ncbi:hypothetical protein EPUS_03986 [Endocarpon pusillum Z07020]|uniref:GAR domain-containing protein n=1 Tax=Endocarpon pusillum (strain Z07020 / HMAS-L-300199) TaxID=1263415 RepID=U1FWQ0_ENDPU|nr:uncharacterized protein EPUS_03986 [Endocarpon pusillum Z07020]ERF69282.1 hypothetical protein EPUS_03986 [Endocarpon pusillum Z07020]
MSTSNPTFLNQNTRFRPASTRSQSRSPSRSPVRKAQFTEQEIDPLLGNLSPTSTLKALSLTDVLRNNESKDTNILTHSIGETSTDQRAYGIKAALAAQKLREWHAEVLGWKWPAKKDRRIGKGFQPRLPFSPKEQTSSGTNQKKEYLGSLPATVVAQHAERIEQIKDGLEALDVDGLKEHVLSAHIPPKSQDGRTNGSHREVKQLSDFTAVITHTMLQALPYLSKLTALLSDWEIRIVVLKHIPELMRYLEKSEEAVQSALDQVCARRTSGLLTRTRFEDTKVVLGRDVRLLGARFDKLLDVLEGHEDTLPETWIDRMDKVETSFAQWTVEAERRVLYNEWMEKNKMSMVRQHKAAEESHPTAAGSLASGSAVGADGQPTTMGETTRNESPVALKAKNLHTRDSIRTNEQPEVNEQKIPSATISEARTRATNGTSVKPSSSNGQDGKSTMVEPQSFKSPMAASGPGDQFLAHRETKERLQTPTSQQLAPSVTPPSFPVNDRSLFSPVSAKDNKKEINQQRQSPTSTDSDLVLNNRASMQKDDAPTECFPMLTDRFLQEYQPNSQRFESGTAVPVSKILEQTYSHPPDHQSSSLISGPQVKQPQTLNLPRPIHRRKVSETSIAGSTVSDAFSDLSDAEIADATTAEALGSPKVVRQPLRTSQDSSSSDFGTPKARIVSVHHPHHEAQTNDSADKVHKKAARTMPDKMRSSFNVPVKTSDTVTDGEEDADPPEKMANLSIPDRVPSRRTVIHRASVSSMEKIPKNRIRSIVVGRKESSSSSVISAVSPLDTSGPYGGSGSVMSVSPIERSPSRSLSKASSRRDYSETFERPERSSSLTNGRVLQTSDHRTATPEVPPRSSKRLSPSPISNLLSSLPTGSKDFAAFRIQSNGPQVAHSVLQRRLADPLPAGADGHDDHKAPSKEKGKEREDLLESKIQNLLTRIPARIRLLSDSEAESPSHPSTTSSSRSQSPIPSLILSPVKPKRRPQANNSTLNSDVRLFHLTRSTGAHNTPPTKLFVRLVGEHGERVMVRVGGGWADLGDYLRDYSLHHSSRAHSNGQFELASLPIGGQKDSRVIPLGPELVSKATAAAPTSSKSKSAAEIRPGSALDSRPSATTPFGVLKPTRRRRSTSATAIFDARAPNSSSTSLPYSFSSHTDPHWDTPPVPAIPQVMTLNPYFGGDPRLSGPPRQPSGAASSTNSPTTATQQKQHQRSKSQGIVAKSKSTPSLSSQRASAGGGVFVLTPTRPATNRISVDTSARNEDKDEEIGGGAPAPAIGGTHSSASTSPKSFKRMSSFGGEGGGIRRVFFRRKDKGVV